MQGPEKLSGIGIKSHFLWQEPAWEAQLSLKTVMRAGMKPRKEKAEEALRARVPSLVSHSQ